jgi:glycosyltransferase involved in cell wall biosynthesis
MKLGMIKNEIKEWKRNGFRSFLSRSVSMFLNPRRRAIKREISNWKRGEKKHVVAKSENIAGMVSVVIPVYDRTEELRESIESILKQTYQNFEIILVTDGSPKVTFDTVESYRENPKIKIFHFFNNTGNAVRGRNKGIKEASGEFVAFQDSDDIAEPDRLEKSVSCIREHNVDVAYGGWRALVAEERRNLRFGNGEEFPGKDFDLEEILRHNPIIQGTVLAKRSALVGVGGLKPAMKYFEDYELWLRLFYFGYTFKSIPDVVSNVRLHSSNNALNFEDDSEKWYQLMLQEYKNKTNLPPKIAYIIPGTAISGGIAVVLQHANRLLRKGCDVSIFTQDLNEKIDWFPDQKVPIIPIDTGSAYLKENIDVLVASSWSTAPSMDAIPARRKIYFVQSDERRFFDGAEKIRLINETYKIDCEYMTEAKWIQEWLKVEFGHESHYVPNGLDENFFHKTDPIEPKGNRTRVLLEGRLDVPFKGMKEAHEAVKDLDCEIWIVSSGGRLDKSWRVDKFFENVPIEKMKEIYSSCDIFLKMSRVEGFFGPPMEAMACGCAVVVGKVTGYDEYIQNEYNALVVEQNDVEGAREAVKRLMSDEDLRNKLIENGHKTAKEWSWEKSIKKLEEVIGKS